jgi:hypothetical protein
MIIYIYILFGSLFSKPHVHVAFPHAFYSLIDLAINELNDYWFSLKKQESNYKHNKKVDIWLNGKSYIQC